LSESTEQQTKNLTLYVIQLAYILKSGTPLSELDDHVLEEFMEMLSHELNSRNRTLH